MAVRGSLAAAMCCAALTGCGDPGDLGTPGDDPPELDEPLDLSVDSLDIAHGALRLAATMVDGAADVSVRLGGDCDPREVGGGVSTLSAFVWSFGDADVADAIACGLRVRARAHEGPRRVNKLADLAVAIDVQQAESDGAETAPQLQSAGPSDTGIAVVFASVPAGAHLDTGESLLEAAPQESTDDDAAADDGAATFVVSRLDFARSVLRGRALRLHGASFATSLSVGGATLEATPVAEVPIDDPSYEGESSSGASESPDEG